MLLFRAELFFNPTKINISFKYNRDHHCCTKATIFKNKLLWLTSYFRATLHFDHEYRNSTKVYFNVSDRTIHV